MQRILAILAAVLICVATVLPQTPPSKPISPFAQNMIDLQKQFLQATVSKNAGDVESAVENDFQGIVTNGDFYDRSEVVESAHKGMPQSTRAYDFRVVQLSDDSAVVAYNLVIPGEHPRYRHMADTWAKVGGQWKLKFRQITPNLWSANDLD